MVGPFYGPLAANPHTVASRTKLGGFGCPSFRKTDIATNRFAIQAKIRQYSSQSDDHSRILGENMAEIRFTIPDHLGRYLDWLSRNIILEKSKNDVARHLLMGQIAQMRRAHHRDEPPLDLPESDESDG